ncbi:MAG: HEAT repeat domain-containing protein [Treponema sp.]
MKKILLAIIITAVLLPSFGDNHSPERTEQSSTVTSEKPNGTQTDSRDDIEKARDTLRYGIESEIQEALQKIDKKDFELLEATLVQVFQETVNQGIRERLFELYQKYEHAGLQQDAVSVLEHYTEKRRTHIKAALAYLTAIKPPPNDTLRTVLRQLLEDETDEYGAEVISLLGTIGTTDDALFLVEFFDKYASDNEKHELIIKQQVAAALEKIHDVQTWDFLLERAQDEEENAYIRASAAAGLAQIGKPEAFDILTVFFSSSEPLLRAAAIKGLTAFTTPEAQKLLLQGFKDDYFKVRLEALQTVQKTKDSAAVPYILHRAKNDPVEKVRFLAIETLVMLNSSEGNQWVKETFCDSKKGGTVRVKILEAALEHNPAVIQADLENCILPLITDDRQKSLRYEMGKVLAKKANTAPSSICEAFLSSSDTMTKSIGLDMFKTNRYAGATPLVEKIAQDEKQGILHRRAQTVLKY